MLNLIFFMLYLGIVCVLGVFVRWEYLRVRAKRSSH